MAKGSEIIGNVIQRVETIGERMNELEWEEMVLMRLELEKMAAVV